MKMKNFLTLLCVLFAAATTLAQSDTTKSKVGGYVSIGVSVTNYKNTDSTSFFTSSYTGIEGGITYENFGLGLVFGRGSLKGLGSRADAISNYFYEVKTTYSFPIRRFTGTVLFGYGGYLSTNNNFIEYGAGVSYGIGHYSFGITYSNWDAVNYLTPSLTYNF